MQLFPFQSEAAATIAGRFAEFLASDDAPYETRTRRVPFFQSLIAITSAGKTPILADALERIREALPVEPIVLWVSKGKVVVEQTLFNLENGKYSELIPGFRVKPLNECGREDIEEVPTGCGGLLLMATVATFNQRDRERRIFKLALDYASQPVWDMLKLRELPSGVRRPLLIVYDEGHNLSDQQSELLLGLAPDAIVVASATPRIPARLEPIVRRLNEAGWKEDRRTVRVDSQRVVESGLIKTRAVLGGYLTGMQAAIDEMLVDMEATATAAENLALQFRPKAIYVCATNVAEGGATRSEKDEPKQPFQMRRAPPILIWRYLTEGKKIDPAKVAVYCDLNVHKDFPLPDGFRLFNGGEQDFALFREGGFEHVIFNLGLQEGWDDESCYFAYIDKSMGSSIQVEQLIGRVLRQPGARHYADVRLNSAHFYVRVDRREVFADVLRQVRESLTADSSPVEISAYTSRGERDRTVMEPREVRVVPKVSVLASEARKAIEPIAAAILDYRQDTTNTLGTGAKAKVYQRIGNGEGEEAWAWVDAASRNPITARALFARKVLSLYPRALNVFDIEAPRLDALIEVGSPAAASIEDTAVRVVETYLRYSRLVQKSSDTQIVGAVSADPAKFVAFSNALHAGYSGLNGLELKFAHALDQNGGTWSRNPPRSGFGVPLLRSGPLQTFYPDFLAWSSDGQAVFGIDTKGKHLLTDDAERKLLDVDQIGSGLKFYIRFVSEGEWSREGEQISKQGLSVWLLRNGRPHPIPCVDAAAAVECCLAL